MRIRPAKDSDAVALAELVVAAWRWAYAGIIPEEELVSLDVSRRIRSFEELKGSNLLFLVAVDDLDHPLGFAREGRPPALGSFDCEIQGLYVDPKATRSGVGRSLVAAICAKFSEEGRKSLCIHTLKANRIGREFYEKLGGTIVAEDVWRGTHTAVWYGWEDLSTLL